MSVGKADSLAESAFQTARREAFEEIGLPLSDAKLPAPFKIEHLCQLPANLARTELGVRPCVAFLSTEPCASDPARPTPSTEETLIPRLDAKEVEAVFTAPFHNFLRAADEISASASPEAGAEAAGFPAEWYRGTWTNWHESRWRMHNFYVPIAGRTVRRPEQRPPQSTSTSASSAQFDAAAATTSTVRSSLLPYRDHTLASEEDPLAGKSRLRVFGMTARILVDAARIAYGEEPEFEHNAHFGDEDMIARLLRMGRLGAVRKEGDEVTKEDLMAAAKI